jgi:hypothetical protein
VANRTFVRKFTKNLHNLRFLVLLCCALSTTAVNATAGSPVKPQTPAPLQPLTVASSVNSSAMTRMIEQRLKTAYLALGYQLQVQYLPAGRSLMMSNKGEFDGELFRIQSISQQYPNLQRVPVELTTLELFAFVLQPSAIDFQHWQQHKNLRVGYVRGFKMAENYPCNGQKVAVTTTAQAVAMLQQGKVDLLLDDLASVVQVTGAFNGSNAIRQLPAVLTQQALFHFLHKKHQALVQPLAAELQKTAAKQ